MTVRGSSPVRRFYFNKLMVRAQCGHIQGTVGLFSLCIVHTGIYGVTVLCGFSTTTL